MSSAQDSGNNNAPVVKFRIVVPGSRRVRDCAFWPSDRGSGLKGVVEVKNRPEQPGEPYAVEKKFRAVLYTPMDENGNRMKKPGGGEYKRGLVRYSVDGDVKVEIALVPYKTREERQGIFAVVSVNGEEKERGDAYFRTGHAYFGLKPEEPKKEFANGSSADECEVPF